METSTEPAKRVRMEEEGNLVASSADGPDNEGIVAGRRKYRRLVIPDSDDDDDDGEDELEVPSGTGEVKTTASVEAPKLPAPTPSLSKSSPSSDEEIDIILDADLDIDEDAEVGDDLVIAGPDGGDEDDIPEGIESPQPAIPQPTAINDSKFAHILRGVINLLISWAQAQDFADWLNRPLEMKAMTFGFWSLLRRLSVDYILAVFFSAIPLEVQALFEKEIWSLEDFLSLPYAEDDGRQGVYGNFATGAIAPPRGIGCDAYVGSTRCLRQRFAQHLAIAERYSVTELPENISRSFHYRQICRDEVRSEFRMLASFDSSIEKGYLLLLEGIFIILFGTYKYPGYATVYSPNASYDLTRWIRERLDLPETVWKGMNAAWPLRQGFYNHIAKSESKCWNPACDKMTYPCSKRPEGAPKYSRQLGEPGNPLGGYLCGICYRYRWWHKALPEAGVLARFAQRLEARAEAGADAACGTCGRLESQLPEKPLKCRDGRQVFYKRRHRVHPNLPGKLLCSSCFHFFNEKKREKNDEEVQDYLTSHFLVAARQSGATIRCENPDCGAIEGSKDCGKKNHIANRCTRKVLCQACDGYARLQKGTLRDRTQVQVYLTGCRVKENRDAGKEIVCENSNCKAVEGAIFYKKQFAVNKDIAVLLCPPCNNYYSKKKHHRTARAVQLHLKQIQLADDRKNRKPIVCDKCSMVEEKSAKIKYGVISEDLTVLCPSCRKKYDRGKPKRDQEEHVEVEV